MCQWSQSQWSRHHWKRMKSVTILCSRLNAPFRYSGGHHQCLPSSGAMLCSWARRIIAKPKRKKLPPASSSTSTILMENSRVKLGLNVPSKSLPVLLESSSPSARETKPSIRSSTLWWTLTTAQSSWTPPACSPVWIAAPMFMAWAILFRTLPRPLRLTPRAKTWSRTSWRRRKSLTSAMTLLKALKRIRKICKRFSSFKWRKNYLLMPQMTKTNSTSLLNRLTVQFSRWRGLIRISKTQSRVLSTELEPDQC